MRLHVGGYIRRGELWKRGIAKYAKQQAEMRLKDHPRIRRLVITFMKDDPNWDNGFHWLVKYDTVEIIIPERFWREYDIRWLVRHELRHAKQILEGRMSKSLERVRFVTRAGVVRHFKFVEGEDEEYGGYECIETGRTTFNNEPWELEVAADERREARGKSRT